MSQALTRARMRDAIRRNLNKEIAKDRIPSAPDGEPSSVDPLPSNALINLKLDEAISFIVRKTGFTESNPVTVSIAAQTANGAFVVNLARLSVSVNEIRRVSWFDGSTYQRLRPVSRDEYSKNYGDWENDSVGTPSQFWIDGYKLYLLASPQSAGSLSIIAGTGVIGFETDNDVIEQLPQDYHSIVLDCATWLIADTQQNDSEMAGYVRAFQSKTFDGIADIIKFKRQVNRELQATFPARRRRVYRGR